VESDPVAPLSVYGRSKAQMEERVLAILPEALVIRTSALFGPWDEGNFITRTLRALAERRTVRVADDEVVSPTYVVDLVHAALDLLIDRESGVWHLANRGALSWADFARTAAELAGMDCDPIEARPGRMLRPKARRPRYSVLGSERGSLMPTLEDALLRYLEDRQAHSVKVLSAHGPPAREADTHEEAQSASVP
jgi:dTDP-4-dehydrorhamnose reductase